MGQASTGFECCDVKRQLWVWMFFGCAAVMDPCHPCLNNVPAKSVTMVDEDVGTLACFSVQLSFQLRNHAER